MSVQLQCLSVDCMHLDNYFVAMYMCSDWSDGSDSDGSSGNDSSSSSRCKERQKRALDAFFETQFKKRRRVNLNIEDVPHGTELVDQPDC